MIIVESHDMDCGHNGQHFIIGTKIFKCWMIKYFFLQKISALFFTKEKISCSNNTTAEYVCSKQTLLYCNLPSTLRQADYIGSRRKAGAVSV